MRTLGRGKGAEIGVGLSASGTDPAPLAPAIGAEGREPTLRSRTCRSGKAHSFGSSRIRHKRTRGMGRGRRGTPLPHITAGRVGTRGMPSLTDAPLFPTDLLPLCPHGSPHPARAHPSLGGWETARWVGAPWGRVWVGESARTGCGGSRHAVLLTPSAPVRCVAYNTAYTKVHNTRHTSDTSQDFPITTIML